MLKALSSLPGSQICMKSVAAPFPEPVAALLPLRADPRPCAELPGSPLDAALPQCPASAPASPGTVGTGSENKYFSPLGAKGIGSLYLFWKRLQAVTGAARRRGMYFTRTPQDNKFGSFTRHAFPSIQVKLI